MNPNIQNQNAVQSPPVARAKVAPKQGGSNSGIVKETPVLVYSSRMLDGGTMGTLTWYSDNTIALIRPIGGALLAAFHCSPQDILKFSYYTDHTTIILRNGRRYYIGLNPDFQKKALQSSITDAFSSALGGGLGLGHYIAAGGPKKDIGMFTMDSKNDSTWWTGSLRSYGVSAKRTSMVKFGFIIIGIGFMVLVGVAFTIAIISTLSR